MKVLSTVLGELFPLFPDSVFHLGADETGRDVSGDRCSKQGQQQHSNAAQIEVKLQKLVSDNGKRPYAWEEMLVRLSPSLPPRCRPPCQRQPWLPHLHIALTCRPLQQQQQQQHTLS